EWQYGRFEIRARLPHGQGLWPAIWMLPTDSPYGGWAAGGEIDIMEAVNLKAGTDLDSRSVHGTLHYGAEWPDNRSSGAAFPFREGSPADSFHVYAVEWEEGEIRWYVDDTHYATQTSNGWYTQAAGADGAAPFDHPFHLILNVAVGGTWPGPPDAETEFPQVMEVDYVRVYECSASPGDGTGCATVSDRARLVPGG
ncbi:MAG: glycoside hydrolase family 16 protein, partial [Acidimicrobiia bacterium]|nr:glycoside hydrolase family 16 protein [Acidimicrobiia bacterium]